MGGRETLRVEDKARMMAEPQGPPESRGETEVRASSLGEAKKSAGGSNNTCSWSHSPGGWKAKVKVSAGQVPLEPCPWFVCDGLLLLPVSPHFSCGHLSSACVCVLIFSFSFLKSLIIFIFN